MGKATQRRERRLAQSLRELVQHDREGFVRLWDRHIGGWIDEIRTRGRAMHRTATGTVATDVFGVVEKAQRLLSAIGTEAEQLVGGRTHQLLGHEASKATAAATNPELYALTRGSWPITGVRRTTSTPSTVSRKRTRFAPALGQAVGPK